MGKARGSGGYRVGQTIRLRDGKDYKIVNLNPLTVQRGMLGRRIKLEDKDLHLPSRTVICQPPTTGEPGNEIHDIRSVRARNGIDANGRMLSRRQLDRRNKGLMKPED